MALATALATTAGDGNETIGATDGAGATTAGGARRDHFDGENTAMIAKADGENTASITPKHCQFQCLQKHWRELQR